MENDYFLTLNHFRKDDEWYASLSKEEQLAIASYRYPFAPIRVDGTIAEQRGMLSRSHKGDIIFEPDLTSSGEKNTKQNSIFIPLERVFDLTGPYLDDLESALKKDDPYYAVYERERETYEEMRQRDDLLHGYGVWVFFPRKQELYHFPPQLVLRLANLASNNSLYHKEGKTWEEIRSVFDEQMILMAGASVGSIILENIITEIRPKGCVIADVKRGSARSGNRIPRQGGDKITGPFGYPEEIYYAHKAVTFADDMLKNDPFINMHVLVDGVSQGMLDILMTGNFYLDKPTIAFDEMDNLAMKMAFRQSCRQHGVPCLMVTDAGHNVICDFRPFHRDRSIPLSIGVSDDCLLTAFEQFEKVSTPDNFYAFAEALVGPEFMKGSFGGIIRGEIPTQYKTIPQSGATASIAGGLATKLVTRMMLGQEIPSRIVIDTDTYEIRTYNEDGSLR